MFKIQWPTPKLHTPLATPTAGARTIDAARSAVFVASMFTIIGGDGKEYGPVTAEQVRAWIAAGRANLDTKAKAVGSDEWKRVGDFAEFTDAPGAAAVPPSIPATPTRVAGPVDIKAFANDLNARAASLEVIGCLSRSFELWKANFLPLVGVTFLVILVQIVIGMIPIIGMLSGVFLNGVFLGGLYYYYLGRARHEPRQVGDAFAGFSKAFVPLMLASLVTFLLTIAIVLPFFAVWAPFLLKWAMNGANGVPPMPGSLFVFTIGAGFLVLLYFTVAWMFTFILVIDKGLGPWTAMEVSRRVVTKQWFLVFFVVLLGGILAALGLIALFVGVIFTLPLAFGAIVYAYEDLFNPPVLAKTVAS